MSWGSAAEGAASAGSTAGEAAASSAGSAGSAAGGAAGGSMGGMGGAGMMQSSAGAAPSIGGEIFGNGGGVASNAASSGGGAGMWDSVVSAVKDYNKGEHMGLGDAIDSAKDKQYAKIAGYLGGKMQGAGGAGVPTPLINLPSVGPQDNTMQDRYSNLYKLYSRRV